MRFVLHVVAALHNLVEDLRALPAVDQLFTACHKIIGLFSAEKALKKAYAAKCAGLGTSGYLRLAPSHRFAYQVGQQRRASVAAVAHKNAVCCRMVLVQPPTCDAKVHVLLPMLQVYEAEDVLANFGALASVCEDASLLRKCRTRWPTRRWWSGCSARSC